MSQEQPFDVAPWSLVEPSIDLDQLARTESLFALSNGHLGLRGNVDEGEPHGMPGTYLNSVFELKQLPYAEAGYGYPEASQTLIDVTNAKIIRLLVDDEPFDIRYGTLHSHQRELDFRTGVLDRDVEWSSPAGQRVAVHSRRMVSLVQRSVMAICYEVQAVDEPARVVLQSELVANEELPQASGSDPRGSSALARPLVSEESQCRGAAGRLIHKTRRSDLRVAVAMDHLVMAPHGVEVEVVAEAEDDWVRTSVTCRLEPGQTLRLVKLVAYGWSGVRSLPALRDQVSAALTVARATGWDGLLEEQADYLREFWEHADVEVEGDDELQQAVRFGLFQVLQSAARGEQRPIAGKGLTGPGYDGHAFWDTETYVLPVLTHTVPYATADALRWRHRTLDQARDRAAQLGLRGAAFPWRTIDGTECSAYWPAGTAAFHINADIADALLRHLAATGDEKLEQEIGVELLVETARLWASLGHHGMDGEFRIDGVTGPDEYSAVADNNVYTNLMAAHNLEGAASAAERNPHLASAFGVHDEEIASWREAASSMFVPFDDKRQVHPQSQGFTDYEEWDFAAMTADDYPLLLHYPYVQLYRKQVVKQADLVLAMQLCGKAFTLEQKKRNVDYYEPLTVRDSSLSSCSQAVMAAEVGYVELAYDYAAEAALMDLNDLHHNTSDGLHMAALAGGWTALVTGLGGMRDEGGELSFCPRMPARLTRLCFRVLRYGAVITVDVGHDVVSYTLSEGELDLHHDGEQLHLVAGEPQTRDLVALPEGDLTPPQQPAGLAPRRRSPQQE